jgi:hypothetical protein
MEVLPKALADLLMHANFFGFHTVCYQNLPTSYIWIAKSMTNIFVQLFTTFAY